MIIIGNTANHYHMGLADKLPPDEFVCWTNKEKLKLIKRLKLKGRNVCWTNKATTVYKKNDTYITVHEAEKFPVFESLKKFVFISDNKDIIAPMVFAYAWTKAKCTFLCSDLDIWEKNIITHTYLYKKYMQYYPKKLERRADTWAGHLTFFGAMGWKQDYREYQYREFDTYTEDSLLMLFRYNGTVSAWKESLLTESSGKQTPSRTRFKYMSDKERLGAIMERLYVDCTNEYVFPEMIYKEPSGLTTYDMFRHTVMNRCAQAASPWIGSYIITHYDEIMEEFDPLFVDQLADAVDWQMLTKVI